jgi:hypothetical protein
MPADDDQEKVSVIFTLNPDKATLKATLRLTIKSYTGIVRHGAAHQKCIKSHFSCTFMSMNIRWLLTLLSHQSIRIQ